MNSDADTLCFLQISTTLLSPNPNPMSNLGSISMSCGLLMSKSDNFIFVVNPVSFIAANVVNYSYLQLLQLLHSLLLGHPLHPQPHPSSFLKKIAFTVLYIAQMQIAATTAICIIWFIKLLF